MNNSKMIWFVFNCLLLCNSILLHSEAGGGYFFVSALLIQPSSLQNQGTTTAWRRQSRLVSCPFLKPNSLSTTKLQFLNDGNNEEGSSSSSNTDNNPAIQQHHQRYQLIQYNQQQYQHPVAREWIERSVEYYSKVTREERRRRIGQIQDVEFETEEYHQDFLHMAKKHYYALRKIKDGKFRHAELIYRKIIDEIISAESNETDEDCDHAKLAVTTLLLALLTQRMSDPKKTRSVFLNFFRIVVASSSNNNNGAAEESNSNASSSSSTTAAAAAAQQQIADSSSNHVQCACSAKVLQAFALFEMKQGNRIKSLQLAEKALQFDQSLQPVLEWKQFRDARKASTTTRRREQR